MAITITTEPADQHAAYTFVEFDMTTDRDDAYSQASTNVAESTFIGSGKTKFIMSGTTSFVIDDIVQGSGFTDPRLNVKHKVIFASGSNVEVDTDWIADFAGDSGQLDKANDNLKIRGELNTLSDSGKGISGASSVAGGTQTQFTILAGTDGFTVDSLVRVTGTTSYNGIHVIDKVAPTSIDVRTAFVASESGVAYAGTKIASKRVSGEAGVFTFNFADMVQSVLSFNIASLTSTGITNDTPEAVKDYAVRFIEEYDDEAGLVLEASEDTSIEHEVIQATRQVNETADINEYRMLNIFKRFLTNQPSRVNILDGGRAQVHFLVDDSLTDVQYKVRKFDANDVQIGVTFTSGAFTLVNHRGIISIEPSMWDASTAYIQVTLNADPSGAVLGQAQEYTIDRTCYDKAVTFYWLNRLGGIDSYTFTADFEESVSVDRALFEQVRTSSSTVSDRGVGTYDVQALEGTSIFSRYENRETRTWLMELFTSPVVYIADGTDLIPVVVTNKSQIKDASGLIQLEIGFTLSNRIVLQHGC